MLFLLPAALAWSPTPEETTLVGVLSMRDAPPPCIVLDGLVPDPVASLTRITEHVTMPPWAPMQAARCLLELHDEAAAPVIERWLTLPNTKGFAKLVVARLPTMPANRAVAFGKVGLEGPYRSLVSEGLTLSAEPTVRALAKP